MTFLGRGDMNRRF